MTVLLPISLAVWQVNFVKKKQNEMNLLEDKLQAGLGGLHYSVTANGVQLYYLWQNPLVCKMLTLLPYHFY